MTPLEDDLLCALSAARPTAQVVEADASSPEALALLTKIIGTAPVRRRHRSRWLIGAPAGLAAAAVAVGFSLLQAPGKPAAKVARPDLRTAVLAAFDSTAGTISHAVDTWHVNGNPAGSFERWTYPAGAKPGQQVRVRQLERAKGAPYQDVEMIYTVPADGSPKKTLPGDLIDVEYQFHTWSYQKNTPVSGFADRNANEIRNEIASGHFTVEGKSSLDGREVIELTWSPGPNATSRLWVDAKTYLPVKSSFDSKVGRPGHLQESGVVTVYDTLPATDANLALLKPPVPAGFKQTAKPPLRPGG